MLWLQLRYYLIFLVIRLCGFLMVIALVHFLFHHDVNWKEILVESFVFTFFFGIPEVAYAIERIKHAGYSATSLYRMRGQPPEIIIDSNALSNVIQAVKSSPHFKGVQFADHEHRLKLYRNRILWRTTECFEYEVDEDKGHLTLKPEVSNFNFSKDVRLLIDLAEIKNICSNDRFLQSQN
jgi:lipopolysaccharide biosynthesis protein